MAAGCGWLLLILSFVIYDLSFKVSSVKATDTVITVTEGEPFNISCTYGLPGIWTVSPQLINTDEQGHCSNQASVTYHHCHVNSAKLTENGTYTFTILIIHGNDYLSIVPCQVHVIVQRLYTEVSRTAVPSSLIQLTSTLTALTTTISSSISTQKIKPTSIMSPSVQLTTVFTSTVISPTNEATAASSVPIVPIIVPIVIVGTLISISIIVLSIAVICLMKSRRKSTTKDNNEDTDTGFLLGNERNDLFNEHSHSADNEGLKSQNIPFTSILFQELVSKSGQIMLVHHASINRRDVLVKQLKEKHGQEELLHEISLLKDLTDQDNVHSNIISFIGATTSPPDPLCLALEYLPHGSLQGLLTSLHKGPIPHWYTEHVLSSPRGLYNNKQISEDLFQILLQVANGAQHLAEQELVHGHLSTSNVFIGRNLVAKLGNFTVPNSGEYFVKTERERFLQDFAPEVISQGEHSTKSDVWSFGVMIYRVATFESHEPFKKISPSLIHSHVVQGTRPPPLPCFSKELYFQMQQCWKLNTEERPDFKQLLNTLTILSQSSWSHFLFEISGKRKGYVSENHQIYLFPSHQTGGGAGVRRVLQRSPSNFVDEFTSGLASSVADSDDTDNNASHSKLSFIKRKLSSEKGSSSQLIISRKKSLIDFERNMHMESQEVSRSNPLANL